MFIKKTEKYDEVTKAVEENFGYCPCMVMKTEDTKCMCKEFRDSWETVKEGESVTCRCGRFVAEK